MSYFSHHPEKWDEIEQNAVLIKLVFDTNEENRILLEELSLAFPDQWRAIVDQVDTSEAEEDFWGSLSP